MEPDMAVELVLKNTNLSTANCRIKTIVGDDDASYPAALRKLAPYDIEKWSDFNHAKKTFTSKLYDMKIPAGLREYFSKMFSLALKQNVMEEEKAKIALASIVPHAFGDHTQCPSFCTQPDDGPYIHKYFKNGQCLTDENLKNKLMQIIQPFINCVSQLAPCGSSQSNESFNNTVCSKHPKSNYYGGSESHCFRVAFSVCQKNLGYEYVITMYRYLLLSPGTFTAQFRKKKQNKSSITAIKRTDIPQKKRRSELKQLRSSRNLQFENKEGITYKSGCGYLSTKDLIDEVIIAGKNLVPFLLNFFFLLFNISLIKNFNLQMMWL